MLTKDDIAKIKKGLTPIQLDIMSLLSKKWRAYPSSGSALTINGERVCNVATMRSLERQGLVQCSLDKTWEGTEKCREVFNSDG